MHCCASHTGVVEEEGRCLIFVSHVWNGRGENDAGLYQDLDRNVIKLGMKLTGFRWCRQTLTVQYNKIMA